MAFVILNGKEFTYFSQVESSETDKRDRYDWLKRACYPLNISRVRDVWLDTCIFGVFGVPEDRAFTNISLCTAEMTFDVCGKMIILEQVSNRPVKRAVEFQLSALDAHAI